MYVCMRVELESCRGHEESRDQQNIIGYSSGLRKWSGKMVGDTSRLFFNILRQPLQALKQAFPCGGTTRVDIP